jgi:hypothetical protein
MVCAPLGGKIVAKANVAGPIFHELRGTALTRFVFCGFSEAEFATFTEKNLKDVGAVLDSH